MHGKLVAICLAYLLTSLTASPLIAASTDSLFVKRGKVAPFRLTDQKNRTVTLDQLRGKVWVASFFFSTCTECNKTIIQQLRRLQDELADCPDAMLVSFTVFPQRDTPEQLALFAEQIGVDSKRWLLLTGSKTELYNLIQKSFGQSVVANPKGKPGAEIGHSFVFLIVGKDGEIVGYINDGKDTAQVNRLRDRIRNLAGGHSYSIFPAINASLNAMSGLILILGYLAVRLRRITLHKICMLTALLISVLFLACYLYYHIAIRHGQPTRFSGEGAVRWIYFAILLSHTILAAIVAPAAVVTAFFGLRNRLKKHVVIARITLPVWLYVSVTGVAVYWMLYQLYPPAG